MANNTYGTKKPALVTSSDVDIFYHYRPTRSSDSSEFGSFKKLDSSLLSSMNVENGGEQSVLPGMYDLKLPLGSFGSAGIYTIYIKPKEIITNIVDVSTLSAYPNIRGVVLSADSVSNVDESIFNDGELVGYRIEYFENGERLPQLLRAFLVDGAAQFIAFIRKLGNQARGDARGIMLRAFPQKRA